MLAQKMLLISDGRVLAFLVLLRAGVSYPTDQFPSTVGVGPVWWVGGKA